MAPGASCKAWRVQESNSREFFCEMSLSEPKDAMMQILTISRESISRISNEVIYLSGLLLSVQQPVVVSAAWKSDP